jgi:transcription elongation factor GreA
MSRTPITREGYDKLKAEIEQLENVVMPEIAKAIAEARAEGDLSENAEYHAQREKQGMLQAKINLIRSKLAVSTIMEKGPNPTGEVIFGSRVRVKDLDGGDIEEYELVGPGEEDYKGEVMKILSTSPLAQGFMNHKKGDRVDIETPGGTMSYEILDVT